MSNDVFIADSTSSEDCQNHDLDEDWKRVVEQQHLLTESKVVKLCAINDVIDREVTDVRVGDELHLRDVTVDVVRVTLEENYTNPDKSDRDSITIPLTAGGKFRPCPHFTPTHMFRSVQEILEVFPFISDLVFPKEGFTVEDIDVASWEILQIVGKVEESPSNQSLRVLIVKRQRYILLPASLEIMFVQWNENWSLQLQDATILKSIEPRLYSLFELCEFWSSKLHPMIVKIHDETTCAQQDCPHQTTKSPMSVMTFFFGKRKISKSVLVPVPQTSGINNEFYMIPEAWQPKRLVLEPIHMAHVTNHNTGVNFTLPGDMKMKVRPLKTDSPTTPDLPINGAPLMQSPIRTPVSDTTTAVPLHQLDLTSLLSVKERSNAIVAVVTSSRTSGSRQPRSLTLGARIALHRTRRVRKMLFKSRDSQYFLASAHYAGEFKRLPLIFDLAGEAPPKEDSAYITRCTAYPVQKQLDSCQEGQYVWFKKHSEMQLNDTPSPTKVVHCMVSKTIDGQQHAATYPLNLRGRFEQVDDTPTKITTRDLFRKNLPVCIKVEKYDPSIGFDPLMTKRQFQVTKIVSELTVVVEILKDGKKTGSGTLIEVPVNRCSLFVREVPLKSEDTFRGIDPYPVRKDFKGLQKLPCVEMLAECDVAELQDACRHISTTSQFSQSIDKESSPSHLTNHSEEKKAALSSLNNINRKPRLPQRKCKSVEDLSDVGRETTVSFQKPKVPERTKRACQSVNYEHAEEFLPHNLNPRTNYEDADDVKARAHTNTESSVIPHRRTKPKPKPRRKTLPSAAYLNGDSENDHQPATLPPMSNGISSNVSNPGDRRSADALIMLSLLNRNVNSSSEKNSDLDSDYDEVQPPSDTGEYQDIEEELKDITPAIPPRPINLE